MTGQPACLAVLVVASALLAGCASDKGSALAAPSELEDEPLTGGTIVGHVINTEAAPVAGAFAVVDELPPVVSDEAGRFVVRGLAAGAHRVQVQALGYTVVARTVDVLEAEPVEVTFTLSALPIETPYIELLIFKGYSQCDYSVWVVSGRIGAPCDTGQAKSQFAVQVRETWQFLVTEMTWQGGVGGYDSFRLFTADDGDCASLSPCYGMVYARNYARLEGEPGKTELVRHYDPWSDERGPPYPENGSFELQVNGQWIGLMQSELSNNPACQAVLEAGTGSRNKVGCLGVGVATGIPYDLYVSLFHSMQPQDRGPCCPATKYTALPDQ